VIIGARGLNQKRLEKETGCRIALRGKGTRARKDAIGAAAGGPLVDNGTGIRVPEDEMDLHVLIVADSEEKMVVAVQKITALLIPVDANEKARQLREVSILNGTFRGPLVCHICGEDGHKMYNCPKKSTSWTGPKIRCSICGDNSHPDMDCPQRRHYRLDSFKNKRDYSPPRDDRDYAPSIRERLTNEYDSFMAELSDESGAQSTESASSTPSSSYSSSSSSSSITTAPITTATTSISISSSLATSESASSPLSSSSPTSLSSSASSDSSSLSSWSNWTSQTYKAGFPPFFNSSMFPNWSINPSAMGAFGGYGGFGYSDYNVSLAAAGYGTFAGFPPTTSQGIGMGMMPLPPWLMTGNFNVSSSASNSSTNSSTSSVPS